MAPEAGRVRRRKYQARRRLAENRTCHCCRKEAAFNWRCRCGFTMCQECMNENAWGMTCNGITWECPDCGAENNYGNQ